MNGLFRIRPAMIVLAVLLCEVTVLGADTLIYRSGRKVEGKMIHINGFRLLFRLKNGKDIAVPAKQVKRIIFSDQQQPPERKTAEPVPRPKPPVAEKPERKQPKPAPRPTPKPPAKKEIRKAPRRPERVAPRPPVKKPQRKPAQKPTRPATTKPTRPSPSPAATTDRRRPTGANTPAARAKPELFKNESRPIVQGPDKILYARRPVKVTLAPEQANDRHTIYYSMNDGGYTKYAAPFVLSRTGFYHIRYYGIDAAGNREVLRHKKIYVDRDAPVISTEYSGPNHTDHRGVTFLSSPFVFVRANDRATGLRALRCQLDGEVIDLENAGGVIAIPTENRTSELVCQARDRVDNQAEKTVYLHLDNSAPTIVFRDADRNPDMNASARIPFNVNDGQAGLARLRLLVDGSAYDLPVTARSFVPADYESKSGATREFTIVAIDRAGNETRSKPIRLRIDKKPPVSELKFGE